MPRGIEQDSNVGLRLELCETGTEGKRVLDGNRQVLDLEVEVHHRALLARSWGPGRRHVTVR